MRLLTPALALLAVVTLAPRPARAGGVDSLPTGTVNGLVVDSAGHPVAGAAVKLEGPQGAFTYQTDEQGRYNAYGLTPGKYAISVSKAGLATSEMKCVNIRGRFTTQLRHPMYDKNSPVTTACLDPMIDNNPAGGVRHMDRDFLEHFR